jgi:hypothetical protein
MLACYMSAISVLSLSPHDLKGNRLINNPDTVVCITDPEIEVVRDWCGKNTKIFLKNNDAVFFNLKIIAILLWT